MNNAAELLEIIAQAACEEVTRLDLSGKNITQIPASISQITNLI